MQEYLVGHGLVGEFGRFRPRDPLALRRGDRVVVHTARGLEAGEILCRATQRHAELLPTVGVGELLRPMNPDDVRAAEIARTRGHDLYAEAERRIGSLRLPLVLLDAEVLFDSEHAALHLVRWQDCDVRPLVSGLASHFDWHLQLEDLTSLKEADDYGCGSCGAGGCGDGGCGDGGCSTGSCGSGSMDPSELKEYFLTLREKMIAGNRVALL